MCGSGADGAESTTKSYAGAVALYLTWCGLTRREWTIAAGQLGSFIFWLRACFLRRHGRTVGGPQAGCAVGARPAEDQRCFGRGVRVLVLRGGSGR